MEKLVDKHVLLSGRPAGTGWLPPRPDLRDYTENNAEIIAITRNLGMKPGKKEVVSSTDLRKWCSPVEDQGNLGSCTAHAGVAIVEYYERKAFNRYINASRLFLYKTTRNLMQSAGDTGAFMRCTFGSMSMFGLPAEKYWPYDIEKFDVEPGAFVYSVAKNYSAIKYFRHDALVKIGEGREAQGAGRFPATGDRLPATGEGREVLGEGKKSLKEEEYTTTDTLESVKKYLQAGIPSMFGFWGFPSFDKSDVPGGIPYPGSNEAAEWGHAVVAVGYDDNKKIKNLSCNTETTGALLIRNSWGREWGDKGYGWLPYEYVLSGLASDFWSLISMNWVDSGEFGI